MKKLLLSFLAILFAISSFAYNFYKDGIYYSYANKNAKTVYVTYERYGTGSYRDTIDIPANVIYAGETYTVVGIGESAFSHCSNLKSVNIPNTVTYIGDYAFESCLTHIVIPESVVEMGGYVFKGMRIQSIILFNEIGIRPSYSHPLAEINYSSPDIWCSKPVTFQNIKSIFGDKYKVHRFIDAELTPMVRGLKFKFTRFVDEAVEWGDMSDDKVLVKIYKSGEETPVKILDCVPAEEYIIPDLDFGTKYIFEYTIQNTPYDDTFTTEFNTIPTIDYLYESTQTTITITSVSASSDETGAPTKYEVELSNNRYIFDGSKITFSNLNPDRNYSIKLIAWYGNDKVEQTVSLPTRSINLSVKETKIGPTSVVLTGVWDIGDAKIVKTEWTVKAKDIGVEKVIFREESNTLNMNGLRPSANSYYSYDFRITTDKDLTFSKSGSFKTSALTLTTLQPQCTTSTTANVAAETNMCDEEVNAGFQWKKYDAPESLAPNEAYAIVVDGRLEGQIKNLQPAFYYKVRAFYKRSDGQYHYGDWITFDPSDFSYFDPTVRTYGTPDVNENSVTLRGYALAGSDPIISQGFNYWANGSSAMRAMAAGEVHTVNATGQLMTTTVTDLPMGDYTFRAFVETTSGFHYGDEQTFSIDYSGVENIVVDETEPEIIGYYDINGRRNAEPFKGFNIILYNNGTSRKVIMK